MRWLTVKEVAARTGIGEQTVRKRFPVTKFGHSVRIWEGDVSKHAARRALAMIESDPGLSSLLGHYRRAEAVIEHLDPNPDAIADPELAALMVSSIAACRAEHTDYPMIGVDAVFGPALDFFKTNLPRGGGAKGDALREMILAA